MNLSELFAPFFRSSFVLTLWLLNLALALAVAASFAWGSVAYLRFAAAREPRRFAVSGRNGGGLACPSCP